MSPSSERRLVAIIAFVQFVNILDFMMVMPLGPDFACSLHIPVSQLGIIGGSYTAAAAIAGFAGGWVLDRFDRRTALTFLLAGLAVGTVAGGFATGLGGLVLARVIAGAFGGPATAVAMAIVSDVVPAERRGQALGTVMMAFAVASVLGVPAGLELARLGSWHTPFFAVGALCLLAAGAAWRLVPSLRGHIDALEARRARGDSPSVLSEFSALLRRSTTQRMFAATAIASFGIFILVPNLAAFTQGNLHYPRRQLGLLYLMGGVASFVTLRPFGRLVDKHGSFKVALAGSLLSVAVIIPSFVFTIPWLPVPLIFLAFMVCNGLRNVSLQTLSTKVPTATERARFMSLGSMITHAFSALGAMASSRMLGVAGEMGDVSCGNRDHPVPSLVGIDRVAMVSIVTMLIVPWLLRLVERDVLAAEAASGAPKPEDKLAPVAHGE
ncbi:MAG: MFS transporter [Myxococcales bacterium]|nr:MFS transporter [Myxococcales bacterium]